MGSGAGSSRRLGTTEGAIPATRFGDWGVGLGTLVAMASETPISTPIGERRNLAEVEGGSGWHGGARESAGGRLR